MQVQLLPDAFMGWIGNIFILVAIVLIGLKCRLGWVFSFLGNFIWCWYAIRLEMWDMLFVDGIALCLAVFYFGMWHD